MRTKLIIGLLALAAVGSTCRLGFRVDGAKRATANAPSITNTPLWELLEPIQAEAARRGDYDAAAAINFLQAAIVEGKTWDLVRNMKP